MSRLEQDLCFALRQIVRSPGFSLTAILSFAPSAVLIPISRSRAALRAPPPACVPTMRLPSQPCFKAGRDNAFTMTQDRVEQFKQMTPEQQADVQARVEQ